MSSEVTMAHRRGKVTGVTPKTSDPGRWVILIDNFQPTPLNKLMHCHWAVKHRLKRDDALRIALACDWFDVPRATGKRRVTLTVTLAPRQRGCDVDAFWKALLDSLKQCGRIVDDGPKWVEIRPVIYVRGKVKATRIELEDLP
jgi:hypothetical protein